MYYQYSLPCFSNPCCLWRQGVSPRIWNLQLLKVALPMAVAQPDWRWCYQYLPAEAECHGCWAESLCGWCCVWARVSQWTSFCSLGPGGLWSSPEPTGEVLVRRDWRRNVDDGQLGNRLYLGCWKSSPWQKSVSTFYFPFLWCINNSTFIFKAQQRMNLLFPGEQSIDRNSQFRTGRWLWNRRTKTEPNKWGATPWLPTLQESRI